MLEHSYSHLLAAQNRIQDLRREAVDHTVVRAARADRRRALREARLAALMDEVAELERLAASAWQGKRRSDATGSASLVRSVR